MIELRRDARVLVVTLPGIGDALMATPMIRALKKHHPSVTIDVACMFDGVAQVLRRNPHVSTVRGLSLYGKGPLEGLRSALSLRRHQYDASILAYPAFRREYHVVHTLFGARTRVSHRFPTGYWSELNFLESETVPVDFGVHNVVNNLRLLTPIGINADDDGEGYEMEFSPSERADGAQQIGALGFDPKKTIAVHPGSTASPAGLRRRWIPDRWIETCRHLIDEQGQRILMFSGPDEGALGKELVAAIDRPQSARLAPVRNFEHAMILLSACRMLIHSDNGFGHLAVALGVPVVSLFGVTDDAWSGPYSRKLTRVVRPPRFQPWHRYELKRGVPRDAHDGMKEISVEAVVSAIQL